jgi:uncharacterized protein YbjQ (UPF0145 family)
VLSQYHDRENNMQKSMITSAFDLPDTESKNVGIVRGITVRSRSIVGNFFGGIQTIFGGNISIYTSICANRRGWKLTS